MSIKSKIGNLWQIFLASIVSLNIFLLFASIFIVLSLSTQWFIASLDFTVSFFIFICFLSQFHQLKNSLKWYMIIVLIPFYFIFLSIPGLDGIFYFLLVRFLNLIKILALIKTLNIIAGNFVEFQEKSKLFYGVVLFMVILFLCSTIFYYVEIGVNPGVTSFEDSIWYVLGTITTIGYGDIIPLTSIGRLTGVISMISAIGITSLITAATTSTLVESLRQERQELRSKSMEKIDILDTKLNKISDQIDEKDKIDDLAAQIDEIKKEIQDIKKKL